MGIGDNVEKVYKTEEDFLKDYDSSKFEKPSITVDIVVFSVSSGEKENWRRLSDKKLSILLVKRDTFPFKDKWCLPGGFLRMDESADEAALRVLEGETGLNNIYLEQLYTFSSVKRDPRTRVVSVTYVALIDKTKYKEPTHNAKWFDLEVEDSKFNLINDETISFIVDNNKEVENKDIAFDHTLVIAEGLKRIKNKVEYTDIAFNLMPTLFTLGELQQVYEAILGKKLLDPAFRRIIADKVVKTKEVQKGGGHRPSVLFKFKG